VPHLDITRHHARRSVGVLAIAVAVAAAVFTMLESTSATAPAVVSGSAANHTCALTLEGDVRCWGENQYRQLGDGTTVDRAEPVVVPVVSAIDLAVGGHHTCVALAGGSVWCWGRNGDGQLGDGQACGIVCDPVEVSGISNAVGVTAGMAHSCALLANDAITCWGNNDHGQLGLGTFVGQDQFEPVPVAMPDAAVDVVAGDWHTCGLLANGTVKCWGENMVGQVGDGLSNINATPSPKAVAGLAGASDLALGADVSCAIVAGGAVRCWGAGYGLTPASVALSGPASDLAAGHAHVCAVVGGLTECWGDDGRGQLGEATVAEQVTAGNEHSCASALALAKCWGANGSGQLGDGTTADSATPVLVLGLRLVNDSDLDGCWDEKETTTVPVTGGLRDPANFWDFYDTDTEIGAAAGTHLQGTIGLSDILGVAGRFGLDGDPSVHPLSDASGAGYHTRYDRGPQIGPHLWNRAPADGAIAFSDLLAIAAQFGHSCA